MYRPIFLLINLDIFIEISSARIDSWKRILRVCIAGKEVHTSRFHAKRANQKATVYSQTAKVKTLIVAHLNDRNEGISI